MPKPFRTPRLHLASESLGPIISSILLLFDYFGVHQTVDLTFEAGPFIILKIH
jgi:hypothetical protein